jgi:hypothetical protein
MSEVVDAIRNHCSRCRKHPCECPADKKALPSDAGERKEYIQRR